MKVTQSETLETYSIVLLMGRYLRVPLDSFITLLELHKLMYHMTEAGEPLYRTNFTVDVMDKR